MPNKKLILNKIEGIKFMLLFFLAVLGMGFVLGAGEIRAEEKLTVTKITRISHPAFDMSNILKGSSDVINADNSKILLWEDWSGWTHLNYPSAGIGRGLVVANIADLKNTCDKNNCRNNPSRAELDQWLNDYKNVTQPLNNSFLSYQCTYIYPPTEINVGCLNRGTAIYVRWSQLPGEENIIYGIYESKKQIVKINVTNGTTTVVGDYSLESSQVTAAFLWGWTEDGKLIFSYNYKNGGPGFLLNTSNGSKEYYDDIPDRCSTEGWRWDARTQVHNGRSPDKKYIAGYHATGSGNGIYINDYKDPESGLEGGCSTSLEYTVNPKYRPIYHDTSIDIPSSSLINHVNWGNSNDWYIGGYLGNPIYKTATEPYLNSHTLWQIFFNRNNKTITHHPLLTMQAAGNWDASGMGGSTTENYASLMSPTMSDDGSMIVFQSTDGKYSRNDYKFAVAGSFSVSKNAEVIANWGTVGIYMAEVTAGLLNTCTSFTYTAWSACQPNNTQTRTVTSSSPSGCTGGNPVLTQSCDTTPPAPPTGVIVQ